MRRKNRARWFLSGRSNENWPTLERVLGNSNDGMQAIDAYTFGERILRVLLETLFQNPPALFGARVSADGAKSSPGRKAPPWSSRLQNVILNEFATAQTSTYALVRLCNLVGICYRVNIVRN